MKYELPSAYIESVFFQYAGLPSRRPNGVLNGCCNLCKEGKSWGRKKRLFYIPQKNIICCHNCQICYSPMKWVMEVTGKSYGQIKDEAKEYDYLRIVNIDQDDEPIYKATATLPHNAINLSDAQQVNYYKTNQVIKTALKYIKERRLDTAINNIPLYISLTDFIHKNRLVLSYYDINNKIGFYQSRSLDNTEPRYLSKKNSDKTIFGLNKINIDIPFLFITEGPIDSMFIQNGISMGGLQISAAQRDLLQKFVFHDKIWILDNEYLNKDVVKQNHILIDQGETVFIWPKEYRKYKDINEFCCDQKVDAININFFISNAHKGEKAKKMIKDLTSDIEFCKILET